MKKILLILLAVLLLPLVAGNFPTIVADTNQDIGFTCFNSTTVASTTATINCTDTAANVDLTTTAATHEGSNHFNITVNLNAGGYTCRIDCLGSNGLRFTRGLYVRTTPLIATDNIGLNLDDTSGTLDETEVTKVGDVNVPVDLNDTVVTDIESILDDTGTSGVVIAAAQTVATCTATTSVTNPVNINDTILADLTDDIWDEAISGHVASGTTGLNLSSKAESTAAAPSAATIADAVWDEILSGHTDSGSASVNLTAKAETAGSGATAAQVWQYADRNLTNFDEDETTIDIDGTTIGTASTCTASTDVTNPVQVNGTVSDNIDSILADTNELQQDDYPAEFTNIRGAIDGNTTTITNNQDTITNLVNEVIGGIDGNATAWADGATATEVWAAGTRTLTVADWVTDSDIGTQNTLLEGAVDGNQSQTETQGDSAWATAAGFATTANANEIIGALDGNESLWVTASGFSTLTEDSNIGIDWSDIINTATTVDLTNTSVTSTVDATSIVNESVECTTLASDSLGCIVWALEAYPR